MGASCSKNTAAAKEMTGKPIVTTPRERAPDISIRVDQINIGENYRLRILKKCLQRNSNNLKRRIAFYEAKLKETGVSDPRIDIFIAEHTRSTELLNTLCRMEMLLESMG